jgi:mannose-1-phosphate guanylyltransferase/mannose-1-phosphate guanylyltransferase/mannose-6-phosphate isomerase
MFDDCLIMAGGSGTRLWPASNAGNPKQFLSIPGGSSFFVSAVERALAVIDRERDGRVIIIAGRGHVPRIIEACAAFSAGDLSRLVLIPEPAARNTAPAIACGAVYSERALGPDRTMLVLTSDHIISPLEVFAQDADAAAVFARQDKLAVFGIPPRAPETGYGYIEAAEALPVSGEAASGNGKALMTTVFRAASFREKPSRSMAEAFLAEGRFYWNSGMFAFSSGFLLEEFRRNAPECLHPFDALKAPDEAAYTVRGGLKILDAWTGLGEAYNAVKGISFDYAIAEKCGQTVMAAARFDWFDVGSWDEYAKLLGASCGEVYAARSPSDGTGSGGADSCFVDADIPVALCGVSDLIVVVRSGRNGGVPSVLIAKKGETQGVRDIVEQIKAAGRTELL